MKRFLALFMALCMCILPTTAFAMEGVEEEVIDYMNYDFPEDAIVLYQGEDGVIYQTHQETLASPRTVEYGSVWLDANRFKQGTFDVTNPTPSGRTYGTFKVQSEDPNVEVQMIAYGGAFLEASKILKPKDGDVTFDFENPSKTIKIQYYTRTVSRQHGMRLMCWLY